MLTGTEVKSIRNGRANIRDGFVRIDGSGNAAWLENVHISPYAQANLMNHEPLRPRKLLPAPKGDLEPHRPKCARRGLHAHSSANVFLAQPREGGGGSWREVSGSSTNGRRSPSATPSAKSPAPCAATRAVVASPQSGEVGWGRWTACKEPVVQWKAHF